MPNIVRKTFDKMLQKKSYYSSASFFGNNYSCNHPNISIKESINLFYSNSTVKKAVDMKANLGAGLQPIVINKMTKELVKNHKVLDLLRSPSFFVSFKEFMFQFIACMEVTGNNFNILTFGITNSKPLQIYNIKPDQITLQYDTNGNVSQYERSLYGNDIAGNKTNYEVFKKTTTSKNFPYIYVNEKNQQLWHSATYNMSSDGELGKSNLATLYDEVKLIIYSLRHNRTFLENGGTPSGLLIAKGIMSSEDYDKLQENFNKHFSGPNKAGKTLVLQGGELEYKETNISPREMDWINSCEYIDKRIYKSFGIPTALIDESASTYNNVIHAKAQLYEFDIFPVLDKIYGELTNLLMPYFDESQQLEIYYSKEGIPSLDFVKTESLLNKSKAGFYTVNELRKEAGLPDLKDERGMALTGVKTNPAGSEGNPNEENKNNYFIELMQRSGYNRKQTSLMIEDLKKEGLL